MRVQKETEKVVKEFSAGGIVARKKGESFYILLVKDSYGRWTWPKGHIDNNETPQEAAVREIGEETGVDDIKVIEKIGETRYFFRLDGALRFKRVLLYLCETKKARLKIQESEIGNGGWFSPSVALKKISYRGSGRILKKAIKRFSAIKNIPVRGAL